MRGITTLARPLGLCVLLTIESCNTVDTTIGRTNNNGEGGSTGVGDAAAGSGGVAGRCPDAPPANGSNCTPPWTPAPPLQHLAAHCSWGDDPRPSCRTTASCEPDGTWLIGK